MTDFARAFFLTLAVTILALGMVLAFELVNEAISGSGFSSGEILVLEFEKNGFSGEAFGREFSFDLSFLPEVLAKLEKLTLLLPPFSQLFLRLLVWIF